MPPDYVLLLLRVLHITFGVFWAGSMWFATAYLQPAVAEAGEAGGRVMQGIQQRGMMKVMPVAALLTIISGIELLRRVSAGFNSAWFGSGTGMTYSTGMLAAIIAFGIGVTVTRPAMLAGRRERALASSRIVAALLLVAVLTMAVGRYV